ncbi:MAG: OsmC family protein [Candidatus Izemoplasmataceae bacterium]|jgi:putative redox protein|uniref:OsmC family protein n=1 Tax=Liberiplasma polymorphum TaxID=3374570 RepID=UPI0037713FB9
MPNEIKMVFDNQYHGIITGHHGSAQVGPAEGALAAYDMVLGGLGACLNHTFQTVADKKRLKFQAVKYDITGVKREEVPTWLKEVTVNVVITGADTEKKDAYLKAMELANEYCSVYQTLKHVAKMETNVTFE